MDPDLDDTVTARKGLATDLSGPDLDDTILPARIAAEQAAQLPIPTLIEPGPPPSAEIPLQLPPLPRQPAAYYSFRIGEGGPPVLLDAAVYIGRQPTSPRVATGSKPRLVRVASARKEISATHLEVRQLGSSVIVTDLRSTNGSRIPEPGGDTRRLRQGESVVVTPGTTVDIGDGVVIEILPMKHHE